MLESLNIGQKDAWRRFCALCGTSGVILTLGNFNLTSKGLAFIYLYLYEYLFVSIMSERHVSIGVQWADLDLLVTQFLSVGYVSWLFDLYIVPWNS